MGLIFLRGQLGDGTFHAAGLAGVYDCGVCEDGVQWRAGGREGGCAGVVSLLFFFLLLLLLLLLLFFFFFFFFFFSTFFFLGGGGRIRAKCM